MRARVLTLHLAFYPLDPCHRYARASPTEDDGFEAYRREFVAAAAATGIAKRQGLGGGAGGGDVLTTATGLQTISGYTPPASSAIPQPVVSQGTILNTGQVPGFNASAAAASSPADAVRQPYQIAVAAVGGVAAGAAMFLF